MKYITAEQFLKEPVEVQKVFIEWWKPSVGDLFLFERTVSFDGDKINTLKCFENGLELCELTELDKPKVVCPLLTEGQLREFIEEKTESKIDVLYDLEGYEIAECDKSYGCYWQNARSTYKHDLLQAYWKVACEIAKEI